MTVEFKAWPKTPRLFRTVTITEKIDGTNAAVIVDPISYHPPHVREEFPYPADSKFARVYLDDTKQGFLVAAQSRKRIITPDSDNYGFAAWVHENAEYLAAELDEGHHYGEWWGQGIQRRYGLDHKRFSLFNVRRWSGTEFTHPQLHMVPVLYQGEFTVNLADVCLTALRVGGSAAAPGFPNPEGICLFHEDANQVFKVLLDNDHLPKSA